MTTGRNDFCHCGSGQKYKKCCQLIDDKKILKYVASKPKANDRIGTIAYYGPNNTKSTKVVVGILNGQEHIDMKKWFSDFDIRYDMKVNQEIVDFLKLHNVSTTARPDRIIGCPHEEGIDYPENESCPLCPFWANRDRWKS